MRHRQHCQHRLSNQKRKTGSALLHWLHCDTLADFYGNVLSMQKKDEQAWILATSKRYLLVDSIPCVRPEERPSEIFIDVLKSKLFLVGIRGFNVYRAYSL